MTHAQKYWVAFYPEYPEGTPPQLEVLEHNSKHTLIDVEIPGMWVEEVYQGGHDFQRISLPDCGTTYEIGLPEIPVIREYLGIPKEADIDTVEINSKNKTILRDFYVYPFQTPQYDQNSSWGYTKSFDYNEEFYYEDTWYPDYDGKSVLPGKMRDVYVEDVCINPMKFNPKIKMLEVSYNFTVEVNYKGGYGYEYSDVYLNDSLYTIYKNLILNFDELNIHQTKGTLHYLIIYHDDFSITAGDFKNFIEQEYGYIVHKIPMSEVGSTYQDVKDTIEKFYEGYGDDAQFVLFIGDTDRIPTVYTHNEYSDYLYQCIEGDDLFPEVYVGRISADDANDAHLQFIKTTEHYYMEVLPVIPYWRHRVSLVASYANPCYEETCEYIAQKIDNGEYEYAPPNLFPTRIYGSEGAENQDIVDALSWGSSTCLYRGHGGVDLWYDWNRLHQNWTKEWIEQINCGKRYAVVWNVTCHAGSIQDNNPDCLAESWMSDEYGSVATMGYTGSSWTYPNNYFSKKLYEAIYDLSENATDYGLRLLVNWATMPMYGQNPWATENVVRLVYLGDPALKFQKTYKQPSYVSSEMENKFNNYSKSVTIKTISPNPAVENTNINLILETPGEVEVSVYDISGRRVMNISEYCQSGENIINLNTCSLSSGVYIINISACDTNIQRRFVVLNSLR